MAQVKTRDITETELKLILNSVKKPDIKLVLYLEANLGFRISDTIKITRKMISLGRIDIKEEKTGKMNSRVLVPAESLPILNFMDTYKVEFKAFSKEYLSSFSRKVQRAIKTACEENGIDGSNVSTHSFRKYYATTVYRESGNDILLVSQLLNHSSVAITQKYLGIDKEKLAQYSFIGTIKL